MTDAEIAEALRTAQNALVLVRELLTPGVGYDIATIWQGVVEAREALPNLTPLYEALEGRRQ